MLKLDNRLLAIKKEINGDILADIGTDHGKIIVSSLLDNKIKKAIAVDISEKSLKKAKILVEKYSLNDKVDFFIGDGLEPLQYEPETIIIAGMGGNEIINILKQKKMNSKFVLVPHQDSIILRKFLSQNCFFVEKDYIIKESGKFYDIIVVKKGNNNYKTNEVYLGKNTPESIYFYERLKMRKNIIEKIIKNIENSKATNSKNKEINKELEEINKCLNPE